MTVEFTTSRPIGACYLSFVGLVEKRSAQRTAPVRSESVLAPEPVDGKYTRVCNYYWDYEMADKQRYRVEFVNDLLGCKVPHSYLNRQ